MQTPLPAKRSNQVIALLDSGALEKLTVSGDASVVEKAVLLSFRINDNPR